MVARGELDGEVVGHHGAAPHVDGAGVVHLPREAAADLDGLEPGAEHAGEATLDGSLQSALETLQTHVGTLGGGLGGSGGALGAPLDEAVDGCRQGRRAVGAEPAPLPQAVGEGDDERGQLLEPDPVHEVAGVGGEADLERLHRAGHRGGVVGAQQLDGVGRPGRHGQGGEPGDDGALVVGLVAEERVAERGGGEAAVAAVRGSGG